MAKFLSLIVVLLFSYASFGQSAKQKLEQTKKDPATTTRAAQADNRVVNKKAVSANTSNARVAPGKKARRPVFKKLAKPQ